MSLTGQTTKGEYKIYIQAVHTEYVYGPPNADGEADVVDRIETPLIRAPGISQEKGRIG